MIYKLIILKDAKIDLKESYKWYKKISISLGKRFENSLKDSFKIIKLNPYQFQIRYENTRVILIETFPYLIHFEVNDNQIIIKAIIHTSRDSVVWKNRI